MLSCLLHVLKMGTKTKARQDDRTKTPCLSSLQHSCQISLLVRFLANSSCKWVRACLFFVLFCVHCVHFYTLLYSCYEESLLPTLLFAAGSPPVFYLQRTELFSVYSLAPPGCPAPPTIINNLTTEGSPCPAPPTIINNLTTEETHSVNTQDTTDGDADLPRLSLRKLLCESGKKEFLRLIKKHSFMILTGRLSLPYM